MDPILKYIVTGLVSLSVGLLLQRFQARPNLKYFLPGTFLFDVTDPKVSIRTDSLTIQNFGRKAAQNIEIIHKERPDHFQFSQAMGFEEEHAPDGSHITKISSLGPKEFINIQYLSHIKPPVLLNVRSEDGPAKLIQVQFQRLYPQWFNFSAAALLLVGLGTILYGIVKLGIKLYGLL
ncbi:hypothetical protein Q672_18015 [Marinobacter sp. EVN1]|uniref:hypothetical protein n=1 Tax=Marinobacter sp. EVN1 TaxID=1397532 RepID=UPI0003B90174|nr:hypothetical protein [Marinobacter sp. EVN1]ERS84829.1 hypothetical protein Q672_18015 [Marinobacter sp. EVN1]